MIKKVKIKIKYFLLWTQRWTKTDMLYLAKGGFWVTLEKTIFNILGIASMLVLANYLDKNTFGIYQYVLSLFAIFQLSSLTGINSSLPLTVARGNEATFPASVRTKIKWGFIGFFISVLMGIYYIIKQDHVLGYSLIIISLAVPFADSFYLYNRYLIGLKKFKDFSKNNILIKILSVSFIIAVVLLTNNIFIILILTIFPPIFLNIFYTFKYYKKYPPNNNMDNKSIAMGKHLSAINLLSGIIKNADKIIIFHFLGTTQIAIYTFAMMPVSKIRNIISGNVSTLAIPKIGSKSLQELKQILPKKVKTITIFLSLIILIYFISAPFLFNMFLPKYTDSIFLSRVFSLSLLLVPSGLFSSSLLANLKKKELYLINSVMPFLKILLFSIFLPLWGSLGMILALMCTDSLKYLLTIFLFYKTKT